VQTASRELKPEQREQLRNHVVNLRQGRFSTDGEFITTAEDVRRIFRESLPAALAEAQANNRKLRVLFYAHGGLVSEDAGLAGALDQLPFWLANHVYPIFFIWETGLLETLADKLRGPLLGRRGLLDIPKEALAKFLEAVGRGATGLGVWNSMKLSAKAASDVDGGARFVAELAGQFFQQHAQACEMHACGHSAGAIFHSFFVPVLLDEGGRVSQLHFLAPAVNIPTFTSRVIPRAGHGLDRVTMFTMKREFELADTAGPYPKSLLYLVHHAFEDPDETPILGLEENLRADASVLNFFNSPVADVVFSVTDGNASPRSATTSRHHGDFDNDAPTMNSVCRRILNVADTTPIVEFPTARTRDFDPFERLATELAAASMEGVGNGVVAGIGAGGRAIGSRGSNGNGVGFGRANFLAMTVADAAQVGATTRVGNGAQPGVPTSNGHARRLALCVGIDAYPEPNTLFGCVNDSKDWERLFTSLGYTVETLRDQQATRAAITSRLTDTVRGLKAGDVFLFQYAAHGAQFPDTSGDEADGQDEVFCPVDMMTAGFIRDDEIREIMNGIPEGALVVCFLDCCHSATLLRMLQLVEPRALTLQPTRGVSKARSLRVTSAMREVHLRTRVPGRVVAPSGRRRDICFAACRDEQVAFETDGHGDFTSRVVPLLQQGTAGLSNLTIQQRIRDAFGVDPRQNPMLDCDSSAEAEIFLQP
jgi:hypothetical protein